MIHNMGNNSCSGIVPGPLQKTNEYAVRMTDAEVSAELANMFHTNHFRIWQAVHLVVSLPTGIGICKPLYADPIFVTNAGRNKMMT